MKVLNIYKPISVTPFELIQPIKEKFPNLKAQKIGYAGRLDPMAHGVMIFLTGEENKKRKKYEKLTKIYKTKLIFGIQTDTYDTMGIITKQDVTTKSEIINKFNKLKGMIIQKYPPYSSAIVDGKRLYKHAREKTLDKIEIPQKEILIYKSEINNFKKISFDEIKSDIINKINKVNGDFRQKEIIKQWQDFDNKKLLTAEAYFEVSSGTYIRSIANELGAIAYDIYRTQIDEYLVADSINVI